jgi:hypothetical protein
LGRDWRFFIPPELQHKCQINFLEFLACIIAQLLEMYENQACPGDCFLGRGDNTSSMGWLKSSNFDPSDQVAHVGLTQYYTGTMIASEVCSHLELQAGRLNSPANDLSHLFDLNDQQLTHHILSEHGQQVQKNFHISPLPAEIECMIYFWLQANQLPLPFNPALMPMQIRLGLNGCTSSPLLASPMTPFSLDGWKWLNNISSHHSLRQSKMVITPSPEKRMLDLYAQIPVRAPSTMWLRHLPTKAY